MTSAGSLGREVSLMSDENYKSEYQKLVIISLSSFPTSGVTDCNFLSHLEENALFRV